MKTVSGMTLAFGRASPLSTRDPLTSSPSDAERRHGCRRIVFMELTTPSPTPRQSRLSLSRERAALATLKAAFLSTLGTACALELAVLATFSPPSPRSYRHRRLPRRHRRRLCRRHSHPHLPRLPLRIPRPHRHRRRRTGHHLLPHLRPRLPGSACCGLGTLVTVSGAITRTGKVHCLRTHGMLTISV